MADLSKVTTLVNGDVFDPQVVSDMIQAKVKNKARMTGYIKVDTTLEGVAGSTVTVPVWDYIGEAVDLNEGDKVDTTKMGFTTKNYTIKKIGKGVMLTDEAQLSGYGNPMGTATQQIAMSISEKLDNDRVDVLYGSSNVLDKTNAILSYEVVVDGVDVFNEEEDSAKVMLISAKQKTQLRKDANFISADKYQAGVMLNGSIGRIAGVDIVVSNKIAHIQYQKDNTNGTITIVDDATAETTTKWHLDHAQSVTDEALVVGDKIKALATPYWKNPIIKLNNDAETEDDLPAVTYYLKRGNLVEHKREIGVGDEIVCTAHGMPALTNDAKVVIVKTKA